MNNGEITPPPPPPPGQFGTPEVFFSGALSGHNCLCLNGALFSMLIYLFLSFCLSFPLFSSLSLSSLFLFLIFWRPFSAPGTEAPKATPRIRPARQVDRQTDRYACYHALRVRPTRQELEDMHYLQTILLSVLSLS